MILLLDTSTGLCRVSLVDDASQKHDHDWQADRELSRGLLEFIEQALDRHGASIHQLGGVGVYMGPGSYTGLRIGITVSNVMAESLNIPVVGTTGEQWQDKALQRLADGESDGVVLPEYGGGANITQPRK